MTPLWDTDDILSMAWTHNVVTSADFANGISLGSPENAGSASQQGRYGKPVLPEYREPDDTADTAGLESILSEYRKLGRQILALGAIKPAAADAVEQVEKALNRLPPGETIGRAIDELRPQLNDALARTLQERVRGFRHIESAFIQQVRDRGEYIREQNEGWRIGPLEFEFRRSVAQARALYNHEELVRWTAVADATDLEKIEARGRALLERSALPDDLLIAVLWDAYLRARAEHGAQRRQAPEIVPILAFYAEVRIALVRADLRSKRPDGKIAHAEMPRWAFAYNLDRYRALGSHVPEEQRLGFMTGSQSESTRRQCVTLNGLDASQDYKQMCHVLVSRRGPV